MTMGISFLFPHWDLCKYRHLNDRLFHFFVPIIAYMYPFFWRVYYSIVICITGRHDMSSFGGPLEIPLSKLIFFTVIVVKVMLHDLTEAE